MRHCLALGLLLLLAAVSAACAEDTATTVVAPSSGPPSESAPQMFPDVVNAELEPEDGGTWTVSATISSTYDTPERYADAWRVLSPDREQLGIRQLTHDHAGEQPFTRSQSGITIPDSLDQVIIQGRDLANGWGGMELEVDVPSR